MDLPAAVVHIREHRLDANHDLPWHSM